MAYPCLEEAKRFKEAYDRLLEIGVNPKRVMRDLAYMAETDDPDLPEAIRRYAELMESRRRLIRCTMEKVRAREL